MEEYVSSPSRNTHVVFGCLLPASPSWLLCPARSPAKLLPTPLSATHIIACSSFPWIVIQRCMPKMLPSRARRQAPILRTRLADKSRRWDDWVPENRLRKLTEENKELANNLKKEMDSQRRAAAGRPEAPPKSTKKRGFGSDLTGSSARGSEERSSAVPQQQSRGTKRGREFEGMDKVCAASFVFSLLVPCHSSANFLLLPLSFFFQAHNKSRVRLWGLLLYCEA